MKSAIFVLLFLTSVFHADAQSLKDDFASPQLDPSWSFVRDLDKSRWSLTERPGHLRLKGSTVTLDDLEVAPVYVERKLAGNNFEATAVVDFDPRSANETAGIALRKSEREHYEFGIRKVGGRRELFIRYVVGIVRTTVSAGPVAEGIVHLRVRGLPKYYRFAFSSNGKDFREVGGAETRWLDGEANPQNVGIGLFASGNGVESTSFADFDSFEYTSNPKDPYADLVVLDPSLPEGHAIFSIGSAEKGIIETYPFITRPSSEVPSDVEARKGLVYAKYGDREMRVDLFRPKRKGKFPGVIIVHGGAWITGHHTMENPLAIALAKKGYVAVTVEHRLSMEAPYPAQIHDLKASVRWLRANAAKYGVDPSRIGAVGESSGGHLVALLGSTNGIAKFDGDGGNAAVSSKVQSVVDIDGPATFLDPIYIEREFKGPLRPVTRFIGFTYAENPKVWEEASPITHVNANSAPVLFLNSSTNRAFQRREDMSAKLKSVGVDSEVVSLPDTPHPFWLFMPWFDVTVGHIDRYFKKTMKGK